MVNLPDEPRIARVLQTGYPDLIEKHFCESCGEYMETAYVYKCRELCPQCAEEEIREELSDMDLPDLAELFDLDIVEF